MQFYEFYQKRCNFTSIVIILWCCRTAKWPTCVIVLWISRMIYIYIYIWLNKIKGLFGMNLLVLRYVITTSDITCTMATIFWAPTQYIIANILMSCLFYYSIYSSGIVEHQCIFFLSSLFLFLLSISMSFVCIESIDPVKTLLDKKKSLTPSLHMRLCPEFVEWFNNIFLIFK